MFYEIQSKKRVISMETLYPQVYVQGNAFKYLAKGCIRFESVITIFDLITVPGLPS